MYHGLDPGDGRYDGAPPEVLAYVIDAETFREHLRALAEAGRRIVDPREVLSGESATALNPGDALLTFDDNDLSHYDATLPILRETGLRALFFVTTGAVGQPGRLDWRRLREMAAAGMSIGAHGHTHRFLTSLRAEERRRELEACRAMLQDALDIPVTALSFPGGRFSRKTLRQARECGYDTVFTSAPVDPQCREGLQVIGRVAIRSGWTGAVMRDFLADQENRLHRMRRVEALRRTAQASLGPILYTRLQRAVWRLRGTRG
jgi:peptidoglycan/xylan/chitin deacetylase (PgdA/CDA1 family)